MNHSLERFDISRKDKHSFLLLSQAFDRKLLEISNIRSRIDEVGRQGMVIEAEIFDIQVPLPDSEGVALKREIIEATAILSDTLSDLRDKIEGVEAQLEDIREEARSEVQ